MYLLYYQHTEFKHIIKVKLMVILIVNYKIILILKIITMPLIHLYILRLQVYFNFILVNANSGGFVVLNPTAKKDYLIYSKSDQIFKD